ncbi:NAD-dependent epimerase/dehydratase family protein [Anditalea andensis]|uniref:NAD-dependent epimerase n=1 Tax=Anditalea andensis TaxID=1048983 RepID=A0A074L0X8_9BACT|nr:NAD-dependent epimerase/dehydratase family protein [Anditalea andensis]KEO74819.1 NAD-dependent epimerase [Anditalea andensis]
MKKIAIVAGGSGLVGMQLLHQLFQEQAYDVVIAVGRRELALKHGKLVQVKVDFETIQNVDLEDKLRENDFGGRNHSLISSLNSKIFAIHAFCTMGTTIKKAGSKEMFEKIDHDYVINYAKWVRALGATKFLFVSAIGADQQASFFYNKVKGKTEAHLKQIDFTYLGILQPSLLLGNRKEVRIGEDIGKILGRIITSFGLLKKYKPIPDYKVAKAMIFHALEKNELRLEYIPSMAMQDFD